MNSCNYVTETYLVSHYIHDKGKGKVVPVLN
jgi:hypothetical protein